MPIVETPQSICRFGIARADITPPVGIYHRMWGAATHEGSTGIHRPLTATAMVFRPPDESADNEQELVLIAVDHVLLWDREMQRVRAAITERTHVDPSRVVITFSHTHAAGLMGLERGDLPGGDMIAPYLDRLGNDLGEITVAARKQVQPAVIAYATGRCGLAANRDFWDASSRQFVCGHNPDGPTDATVVVARVTNAGGSTVATIVNYACHPTTLAWQNTLLSPDYPGAMRQVVEERLGSPCVFLQGTSGDLGPRDGYTGDVEVADANGRQLGYAALAALASLPPPSTCFRYCGAVVSGATIGTWAHRPIDDNQRSRHSIWRHERFTIDLPYRPDLPARDAVAADLARWQEAENAACQRGDADAARDARAMVERAVRLQTRLATLPAGTTFPYPVTLLRVGDAVWITLEGELYHYCQTQLRLAFPNHPLVISELANGSRCFYLPTRATYGKGIYEESVAVLAAGALETLVDAVKDKISGLVN